MNKKRAVSNDQFITEFRDWLLAFKVSDGNVEYAISYVAKLAKLAVPVPLAKMTKAAAWEFYWDEQMSPQPLESRGKLVSAQIYFDAFLTDNRRNRIDGFRTKVRQGNMC